MNDHGRQPIRNDPKALALNLKSRHRSKPGTSNLKKQIFQQWKTVVYSKDRILHGKDLVPRGLLKEQRANISHLSCEANKRL